MAFSKEITSIVLKYKSAPDIQQDMMVLADLVGKDLVMSAKGAQRRATAKEHNTVAPAKPLSPLQVIINQTPSQLKEDLYAAYPAMLELAGTVMINTVSSKSESRVGTLGEILDYLVEPSITAMQEKFPDITPGVNHSLYALAVHCLFTAADLASKTLK